jgi:hypothetical protein
MRRAAAWLREAAHVSSLWVFAIPFAWIGLWALAVEVARSTGH